jgi:signal transduction histidine kinase
MLLMGAVLHHELVGEYERGSAVESPSEKIADTLLFYGLPTVIVIVLGGSWLIRRTLKPVETFTAVAERIHAGNLTERMPSSGQGDELDRLAGVINAMLARVEAGIASVRDFTLHASHELKTPLTILSAETELALANPAISGRERERLSSQIEEVRRLAALVDALSLLAKSDAGLSIVAREAFAFDEVLRAAVESARLLAVARDISIELIRCDSAVTNGDRSSLRQALLNLLDNAMKHNQPGGWVRVELRAEAEHAVLSFENTGAPIPPDLLPRVFDRFVRNPDAAEGSGLGLSIVKTIVVAHGGTITCQSRSEGGALFTIRIPVASN